eukprot:398011-Prorocentrum_minimum.AAC.2
MCVSRPTWGAGGGGAAGGGGRGGQRPPACRAPRGVKPLFSHSATRELNCLVPKCLLRTL